MVKTTEDVELVPGIPSATFSFYEGKASNVPVLDIGELLAKVTSSVDYLVVGDTNDAFTVFLSRDTGISRVLAASFTAMSFGDAPADGPPMHKAQYNRFHLVVADFGDMKQINVPFAVPEDLMYEHEKAMWGIKQQDQPAWTAPKEQVYDAIAQFVEPVINFIGLAALKF